MKFNLVFENSGDTIPFEVYANHNLFEYFVDRLDSTNRNLFSNHKKFSDQVDSRIKDLHWAICKVNEVLPSLIDKNFEQFNDLLNYLDQNYLNKLHKVWADSQEEQVNVNKLLSSSDSKKSKIGWQLHEMLPDEIPEQQLGSIMEKLGLGYAYEQVNKGLHNLESSWKNTESLTFTSSNRYDKIHHQFKNLYANNDSCHFSFAYTFVGRQYYDKFINYDTELQYDDHYNYQYLEHTFNLNLQQRETKPFSQDFLNWCSKHNVPPVGHRLPIANITNLNRLTIHDYVTLLYRNIANDNHVYIDII